MIGIIRHAGRRLGRARAFAVTAVLTLTLGIGGATTVFTVVNGVLLRPLPYEHSEQLVDLSHSLVISGATTVDQSDATYLVYSHENRVFSGVGAYRSTAVNLGGLSGTQGEATTPPERVAAAITTASVFGVLDVAPVQGRGLSDDDSRPGAPPVAVIGQRLWARTYASDPAIVGKRVMIDGLERTIVGVAPETFHFPNAETVIWLPLTLDLLHTNSAAFDYRGIARLKPGMSVSVAAADLQRLLPRVPEVFPGRLTAGGITAIKMRAVVRPLQDVIVGDVGRALWIVLGAVGVLLFIACANVANLFLARAEGRQRELAVRRALGAGRGTLLVDFLSEAGIIAAVGGALGLVAAASGVHALQSVGAGASIPRLADVHIDGIVVAVTAGIVALAAIIVSVVPMMRSGTASLSAMLMANGGAAGRARHGARRVLVVAQVALALILLTAAGLLARSFSRLRSVDPGFIANHAIAVRMTLPSAAYPTSAMAARAILRSIDAVAAIPGVRAAGVTTKVPLDAEARQDSAVFVEDRPLRAGGIPNLHQMAFVTPGYFRAMGIPLVAGRVFEAPDPGGGPSTAPPEVIVSQAFAQRYWKGGSAIGKRVRMNPGDPWHTIVGVVGSVRDEALEQPPTETVYSPLVTMTAFNTPWTPRDIALVVRTSGDESALVGAVRRAVHDIDPALPLYRVMSTSTLLSEAAARTTFTLLMLGVAALIAMTIGAVGIYGVISYLVSLRTREIGVRLALGATPSDMRRFVTKQALVDAAIGVGLGVAGAAVVTRVLRAVLFDVSPTDPETMAAASALLLVTALAASWFPARRAARLDPASTLRSE